MKNHERQISQEIKIFKQSAADISPYRFEVIAKNFRKKHQPFDITANSAARLDPYRKSEGKTSPIKSQIKTKTNRKRSLQKFLSNHKVSERVSLNHPQNHQTILNPSQPNQTNLSTKSKMMKINSILCHKAVGTSKEMLLQIYSRHEEYRNIIKQWKHLDIYDEVDKLVQNLVENQILFIEDLLEQTYKNINAQLTNYDSVISTLQEENKSIQRQLQSYQKFDSVILPLKQKLMDQYEKSQWSTFIMNSLSLNSFDMETFIKQIPLYRKWIAPILLQEMREKQQNVFQQNEKDNKMNLQTSHILPFSKTKEQSLPKRGSL